MEHDLLNKKFGRLTLVEFRYIRNKRHYFYAKCDCGNSKIVCYEDIKRGDTLSCGCIHRETLSNLRKTHGESKTRLYKIWLGIKKRCYCPTSSRYTYYGGRGIKMCSDWNSFFEFKKWAINNNYSDCLSIDRKDANGNYEPNNCRWVSTLAQANNKRTSKFLLYNGEVLSLAEWCRKLNLNYNKTRSRLRYGWSVERAFEEK